MLESDSVLIPGSIRLRNVKPILDGHRGCPVLLDLERSQPIPVPMEFRLHIAEALEVGNPDEDLLAWLTEVGLITGEAGPRSLGTTPKPIDLRQGTAAARLTDFAGYREWYIDRLDENSVDVLSSLLERAEIGGRTGLVIGAEEAIVDPDLLQEFLEFAEESTRGGFLSLHVTLDPAAATTTVVDTLHRLDAKATVRWESSPEADQEVEAGRVTAAVERLRGVLAEEPVTDTLLGPGERLQDFWQGAKAMGLQRIEALKREDPRLYTIQGPREEHAYSQDLSTMVDEMFSTLEEGHTAPLYQPVARVVNYLIQRQGLRPLTQAAQPSSAACANCWAQDFCSRSRDQIDPVSGGRRFSPADDRCDFWRAEVNAGIVLYERLREADPVSFLGFPVEINAISESGNEYAAFGIALDFDHPS